MSGTAALTPLVPQSGPARSPAGPAQQLPWPGGPGGHFLLPSASFPNSCPSQAHSSLCLPLCPHSRLVPAPTGNTDHGSGHLDLGVIAVPPTEGIWGRMKRGQALDKTGPPSRKSGSSDTGRKHPCPRRPGGSAARARFEGRWPPPRSVGPSPPPGSQRQPDPCVLGAPPSTSRDRKSVV